MCSLVGSAVCLLSSLFCRYNAATDKLEAIPTNHNLINLFLLISGPQHERTLCRMLLVLQIVCSVLAFIIRYQIAAYFYTAPEAGKGL